MSETRDPDISRLYREASAEVPPPALGRALSVAAAAAVRVEAPVEVPRARRKWGAPLALAASVVLGLGIVLRVAVERPDMRPAGQEPAVASAPQMPVTRLPEQSDAKAASGNSTDSVPQAGGTPEPAMQRVLRDSRAKAAEVAAATAPPVEREGIAAMKKSTAPATQPARPEMAGPPVTQGKASVSADVAPAAAPAPALAVAPPPAAKAAPMAPADAPEPARAARDLGAAVQEAASAPAAAPAKAERRAAGVSADAARLRIEPGAGEAAQRIIAEEKTLLPADWIKRIIDMRRAGRTEDADASLRRFVERYPGHAVPDAARGP